MLTNLRWFSADHSHICGKNVDDQDVTIPCIAGNLDYDWIVATSASIAEYVAPVYVPDEISDRQFFQQLSIMGLITQAEALSAVQVGTIPAAMETFIGSLPSDSQFSARMVLTGATTFQRSHPLVAMFAAAQGMTSAQIDALWIAASAL